MDSNTKGWLIAGAVGLGALLLFARRSGMQLAPKVSTPPPGSGPVAPPAQASPQAPTVVVAPAQWSIGWRWATAMQGNTYLVNVSLIDASGNARRFVITDRPISLNSTQPALAVPPTSESVLPPELQGLKSLGVLATADPSQRLAIDNEVARYLTAHPDVLTSA